MDTIKRYQPAVLTENQRSLALELQNYNLSDILVALYENHRQQGLKVRQDAEFCVNVLNELAEIDVLNDVGGLVSTLVREAQLEQEICDELDEDCE